MRPPLTLIPSRTMLCWLFCTTLLLMFFNIAADAQQPPVKLGLAGIDPNVELPKDSWYIRSRDELDQYEEYTKYDHKDKTFSPCKVNITDYGFEVFYDELASNKGCTVDLIVYQRGRAFFTAKMMDLNKNCISKADIGRDIIVKSNDNLIPFVFGYTNDDLMELSKGPAYGGVCTNEAECKKSYNGEDGKCIKRTILEIGWSRSNDESIYGHLHQVGEPVSSWNIQMDKKEEWDKKMGLILDFKIKEGEPTIVYHIYGSVSDPTQRFSFIEKEDKQHQPFCNIPSKATPTPRTWQIKSIDGFLDGKHLLSLHFFPQKSTVYHYRKEGQWMVDSTTKIDGPKCKNQSFVFVSFPLYIIFTFYLLFLLVRSFALALLMVGPKPEPLTPSTQSTMGITSSGSTRMPTTTTATKKSKQTAVETTATTSEFPEETTKTTSTTGPLPTSSQAADSGSSTVLIISIVAGLIAFIILIAILIYCLCRRKKEVANDKEEEVEDEEDSSEVENSEVFENFVKKQQPSLMITEKNKPTGEITTDWTDYETIEPKKIKVV